jgi:hypothetical protein
VFLIDNIFVMFGGHLFQVSWHSYWYHASLLPRLVPLFIRDRLHTSQKTEMKIL